MTNNSKHLIKYKKSESLKKFKEKSGLTNHQISLTDEIIEIPTNKDFSSLNLAQAVVHLATAPKSNTVTKAIFAAKADLQVSGNSEVPKHLRDAHYQAASSLGHGEGYIYPHNDPSGWVEQVYRPAETSGNIYYDPSKHGFEAVSYTHLTLPTNREV